MFVTDERFDLFIDQIKNMSNMIRLYKRNCIFSDNRRRIYSGLSVSFGNQIIGEHAAKYKM